MTNQSQTDLIRSKLETDGEVTRNWCLQRYISRLSAIILNLRKEGMKIEGDYFQTPYGKDYKYVLQK